MKPLDTSEIRKRRQAWMDRTKFTEGELPHVDVASACFLAVVDVPELCDALDAARAALREVDALVELHCVGTVGASVEIRALIAKALKGGG